mgnify:CR=1 FL=1
MKNNARFVISFLIVICGLKLTAQSHADTGKVSIIQDSRIDALLSKNVELNSKALIKGYRVKIHFGADKNKAKEIKAKFMTQFPSVEAYEKYDQPNFNIRVGNFRTKLEAYKFLKQVQADFPTAFIVQDDIEFPELESEQKKP